MAINTGGGPNRGASGTAANGAEIQYRTIGVSTIEQKTGGAQGVYWKVQDEKQRWYFVWSNSVVDVLDAANDSGTQVLVRVEIKPSKDPKRPYYTITTAGAEAQQMQRTEGGSSGSYGGTPPSPAGNAVLAPAVDEKTTIELALLKAAVVLAVGETQVAKPKESQAFIEAQVVAYRAYLRGLWYGVEVEPEAVVEAEADPDDDIPF